MTASQLGTRSSLAVVVVGVAYAVVLGAGMARHGLSEPIADPILAVMELLTIVSALPVLGLFVSLHASTAPERRLWATLAICFAAMFACLTMGVHVVELTAGRALGRPGLVWPSVTYAVELFAWDFLLGLALVTGAAALAPTPDARRLKRWMRATGGACLAGLIGPLVGDMRLQLVGVFGYAILLPIVAWSAMGWFRSVSLAPATLSIRPPE